jgi:hypothetical protein
MKKIIGLLIISFSFISLTYASFPVTEPAEETLIEITEPTYGSSFNWQAIVSVSCLALGWLWFMVIPGLIFGIISIEGDKNMKWLGWIGFIGNALWMLLLILYDLQYL